MPEEWEWGLRPLSSTNPPTQEVRNYATRVGLSVSFIAINLLFSLLFFQAKDRFPGIESDRRGRCRKRGLDKFDPDPVIFWKDLKMGRTPAARLGKTPPEPSGSSDELTILEVAFLSFLSYSFAIVLL
jgi:hypothetical protein